MIKNEKLFCQCNLPTRSCSEKKCEAKKQCYYSAEVNTSYAIIKEQYGCVGSGNACVADEIHTVLLEPGLIRRCCSEQHCSFSMIEEARTDIKRIRLNVRVRSSPLNNRYNPYLPIVAAAVFGIAAIVGCYKIYAFKRASSEEVEDDLEQGNTFCETEKSEIRERKAADDVFVDEQLSEVLGSGSFGRVYLSSFKGQNVAVKVFEPNNYKWFMIEQEMYYSGAMHHDLILRLLFADSKIINGKKKYILVTDFCELGSLQRVLKDGTIFTIDSGLSLCFDLASGLDYLHRQTRSDYGKNKPAIAHRDLKSSNVFLRPSKSSRSFCTLIIGDFGLAIKDVIEFCISDQSSRTSENNADRTTSTTVSKSNATAVERLKPTFCNDDIIVGCKRYRSPECLLGTLNFRDFYAYKLSDVYAMALIMWELRTRMEVNTDIVQIYQSPYQQYQLPGVRVDQKFFVDIVALQRLRPTFPDNFGEPRMVALEELIQTCWHQNPEYRYMPLYVKNELSRLLNDQS